MASIAEIAHERTDLTEPAIAHLQLLVTEWTLMADLGFADLVLWLPTWNDGGFVAAAQVRPTTGPTQLHDDVVGSFASKGRTPILDRAFATRLPVLARAAAGGRVPQGDEAFPVMFDGRPIAVLQRRSAMHTRAEGLLERTYLDAFDALTDMVRTGAFPIGEGLAITGSPPRVGDGCFRVDAAGVVTFASPNAQSACHRLGLTTEVTGKHLGRTLARLVSKSGGTGDALLAVASGRAAGGAEVEHRGAVVTLRGVPLRRNGRADGAIVLSRDVSDLRRREKALLTKDATIREIHHRVKNNLQTVAALLRLQSRRSDSDAVRSALDDAVRRVSAIAVVHDSLAQQPGALVDFDEVIDRIVTLSRDMSSASNAILRVGGVGTLPAEIATPLAMSLAELIGNAVEHGCEERPGPGEVTITADRGERLTIHVDDNGTGDHDIVEGLGLSIVRSLVTAELRGTLTVARRPGGGVRATIDLPL